MKAILALAVFLATQQVAFGQQKERDASPAAPSYEGKTLSEWIALTKDKNGEVRANAASALKTFRPQAKTAVPVLIEMLKDTDKDVRLSAAKALGGIGSEAEISMEAVIESLKSDDKGVHWNDAPKSGEFGPKAKVAVPALAELLTDKDTDIRLAAVEALENIGSEAKPAALALIKLLSSTARVSWQGVYALRAMTYDASRGRCGCVQGGSR